MLRWLFLSLCGCTVGWSPPDASGPSPSADADTDAEAASSGAGVIFDTGQDDDVALSGGADDPWAQATHDGGAPFNTCAEARGATPVGLGEHRGSLAGFQASNLRPSCPEFRFGSPSGVDAYLRVVVPPGELLMVDFEMGAADVALALLTDCAAANTCVAGADDNGSGGNARETAAYENASQEPVPLYLHLSRYGGTQGAPFVLEVNSYPLQR